MFNFDNYSHEYKTRRIFALWIKSCYWGVGVLLVNCYVSYKTFIESKKLKPISHYEFHKAITLALIDPEQYWPDRMTKKHNNKTVPLQMTLVSLLQNGGVTA